MSEKLIQTRIVHKHAQEADWNDSTLKPLASELLIYESDDNHNFPRFKVGDGTNFAKDLPFLFTNPVFVGSTPEYEAADAAGLVPIGTIVIITDNGTDAIPILENGTLTFGIMPTLSAEGVVRFYTAPTLTKDGILTT